jgi:hypothetical protein
MKTSGALEFIYHVVKHALQYFVESKSKINLKQALIVICITRPETARLRA